MHAAVSTAAVISSVALITLHTRLRVIPLLIISDREVLHHLMVCPGDRMHCCLAEGGPEC